MASPSITSLPEKTINTYLSKWNASSLPIQYTIENDKYPVGATVTNYYTEVMVYVNGSLVGTIKQVPDLNNETKIDIRKYVQSILAFNKGGNGQIDTNAFAEFYIEGSENYVDSSGVAQSNSITGGGSGVVNFASLSGLQFGNSNGGNMYDYVLDSSKLDLAKWMTTFERGKIIDYNNLTMSIIVDESSDGFDLEVNQYDINGDLLDTSTTTTNTEGDGLYRFTLDEQDISYDFQAEYITIQAVDGVYATPLSELMYIDVDLGCTIAPSTPIELTATEGGGGIILNWIDKAFRDTGYQIQRSLTGVGSWSTIATIPKDSQTYTDTGVLGGNTYYYRVKALQTDGISSAYSNVANENYPFSFGNALQFDGTNDYVSIAAKTITNQSTISFWVNWDNIESTVFYTSNSERISSLVTTGEIIVAYAGFVQAQFSFTSIPTTGVWNHYVITRNGTKMNAYLNGVLSSSGEATVDSASYSLQELGKSVSGSGAKVLRGILDQVAIWNGSDKIATQENVTALYNSGNGDSVGNIISNPERDYELNSEGTSTTAVDSGSDGEDGTLTNFPASGMWVTH